MAPDETSPPYESKARRVAKTLGGIITFFVGLAGLILSIVNRQDLLKQAEVEHRREMALSLQCVPVGDHELLITVPPGYSVGNGKIYWPPAPENAPRVFREGEENRLDLSGPLTHYAEQLEHVLRGFRAEHGGMESIDHATVKIPVIVSVTYSHRGETRTARIFHHHYCDVRWKREPEPELRMSTNGFLNGWDMAASPGWATRESAEIVSKFWEKRKAHFLLYLKSTVPATPMAEPESVKQR